MARDDDCPNHPISLSVFSPHYVTQLPVGKGPSAPTELWPWGCCSRRTLAEIQLLFLRESLKTETHGLFPWYSRGGSVWILPREKKLLSFTRFSSLYNRFVSCANRRAPQMFVSFNSVRQQPPHPSVRHLPPPPEPGMAAILRAAVREERREGRSSSAAPRIAAAQPEQRNCRSHQGVYGLGLREHRGSQR